VANADSLRAWIGRSERRTDILVPWPLAALAATLGDEAPPVMGDAVPPGGHWLYFLDATPLTRLGPDGHPLRGGFLPPVQLPRRMWAGGRLTFLAPLRVGDTAERLSEVADVRVKQGRTGELVFVQVRHTIGTARGGTALVEEHDIVYRDHDEPGAPAPTPEPAPTDAAWTRTVHPSPVMLFRYSALTFNGHRIHYDRPYAAEEEGYPGLLVHGPLMATLLLDLVRRARPDAAIVGFWYRAMAPVFDTAPFTLNGHPDGDRVDLWVTGPAGELAMRAEATLA